MSVLALLYCVAILALAAYLAFSVFGHGDPPTQGSTDLFKLSSSSNTDSSNNVHKRRAAGGGRLFDIGSDLMKEAGVPPQQQRMLSFLEDHCVAIPVKSGGRLTKTMTHPTQFYEELKKQITQAERSVFFSALYVGEGPLSTSFMECLEDKVAQVVAAHEATLKDKEGEMAAAEVVPFEIGILLDYNRMQDKRNLITVRKLLTTGRAIEGKYSTSSGGNGNRNGGGLGAGVASSPPSAFASSAARSIDTSLEGTGNLSPVKVRLYLYQNPSPWNRAFALISRAKEALGVQHTKIFVFDKQHVILTGANLSDDYFATRMDRYILFRGNAHLAFFFLELLKVLFAMSHPVVSLSEFRGEQFGGSEGDLVVEPQSPLQKLKQMIKKPKQQQQRKRQQGKSVFSDDDDDKEKEGEGEGADVVGRSPSVDEMRAQMLFPLKKHRTSSCGNTNINSHSCGAHHSHGSPTLHTLSELVILPNALGRDPSLEAHRFNAAVLELYRAFGQRMAAHYKGLARSLISANRSVFPTQGSAAAGGLFAGAAAAASSSSSPSGDTTGYDAVIFPTVQFGRAGVFHDSLTVEALLALASSRDHIYLTSPYLNVFDSFLEVLVGVPKPAHSLPKILYPIDKACPIAAAVASQSRRRAEDHGFHLDCITASVKTNGWNGQRGFAGSIPFFYLQLERAFFFLVKAYGCLPRVRVREFTQDGLTFHAKGLYFTSRDGEAEVAPVAANGAAAATNVSGSRDRAATAAATAAAASSSLAAPYLVAYGSTNYGCRSVYQDVEAEAFLFTFNRQVREQTRLELHHLLSQSTTAEEAQFVGNELGRFQPVVSLIAQMGKDFL